ncbi:MAG: alpha/beta fold hydrolase [Aggregatilineales bacterium]
MSDGRLGVVAIGLACVLTLTACGSDTSLSVPDDSGGGGTATWTPLPTIVGAVQPSPTTNPAYIPPTQIVGGNIGANDFVPGAVPTVSGGLASATITPTPAPTQPSLPLFVQSDGLTLIGRYYPAVHHPAAAALLLHGDGENKEGWGDLAVQLQQAGYSALAIDLRGFGETGGTIDWTQAPPDSIATLSYIHSLPGIDPAHSVVIGDGVGATLALTACAADPACQTAVLISPQLTIHGLSAQAALQPFTQSGPQPNKRALLIVVASDSPNVADTNTLNATFAGSGVHQILRYPGDATGMALLAAHPESLKAIVDWLTSLTKK